ncbi:MAG: hypothetical protein ACI32P_10665 [Catenibacterium mitsuokai]
MKKWTTPRAMEECFTANVDVAVAVTTCYKVTCNASAANEYEKGHDFLGYFRDHTNAKCTFPENNEIQTDPRTHKITGMIGNYENGKVVCQFTDSNYQPIESGDLQIDTIVYWTSPGYVSTYHHQGYLQLADPNKKCMS